MSIPVSHHTKNNACHEPEYIISVYSINVSPDGRTLATGDISGRIRICTYIIPRLNPAHLPSTGSLDVGEENKDLMDEAL